MGDSVVSQFVRECVRIVAICAVWMQCGGCDACELATRSGTRESDFILSPRPNGGTLITLREVVPKHLQANCDVCPFWCTQADLRPIPAGMLVDIYRHAARDYAAADSIRNGNGWQRVEQMACIAAGSDPATQAQFMTLTADSDPAVRFPAAVHALRYGFGLAQAKVSLRAMIGDEIKDGVHDGPHGSYYATWSHIMLIDHEEGGDLDLP